jgi:hypothetical protein
MNFLQGSRRNESRPIICSLSWALSGSNGSMQKPPLSGHHLRLTTVGWVMTTKNEKLGSPGAHRRKMDNLFSGRWKR